MGLKSGDKILLWGEQQDAFARQLDITLQNLTVRQAKPVDGPEVMMIRELKEDMRVARANYIKDITVKDLIAKHSGLSVEELEKGLSEGSQDKSELYGLCLAIIGTYDGLAEKYKPKNEIFIKGSYVVQSQILNEQFAKKF